ncbi:MAG: PAS domain-containing protein, partial [Verrucomicrobiales bacterium]
MNKNAGTSRNRKIKDVTTAGKTSIQPAGSAEFQALLKMKSIVVARLETRTRRFLAVSPAFVDLTGYSEAELSSLSLDQITLPEDAAKSRGLLEQIWLGQAPDAQWEQRCLKKDGTVIWLNLTETLIQSGPITEDDPLESIILAQDIDERKKSELEQMLRAFESRFKSLVNSIEGIVWECIVGAEGIQFSFVSDKAERLLGYPVEQWITEKNFWQNHIHPEDRKWAVEFCATATAAKRDHELEYRMIAADGKVVWLRDLVTVVAEQGQPMRLVGVMVDMTAHKQTEQTVKATEERLRRTQSTGRLGVWEWELESRKVTWTDGIYELLGLVPGSFDPSFDRWKEFIFEEDNARTMEAIQRAIESEGEFRVEFRVRRADGEVRWLGVSGRVENDESGKPLRMIGVNVDITKQKLTEAALVESRARERAFLEHLPVGVWFLNAQGEIVYGNPAGQQIWEGARFVEVEKFGEYNGWWHGSDRKIAPKEWAAARAVMKGETTLEEAVDIQ